MWKGLPEDFVHVISEVLIALSLFAILFLLFRFGRRRRDLYTGWMAIAFGIFLLACGATHLLNVWAVWQPHYWLHGIVKAIAAVSSVATVALLVPLLRRLIKLPGPSDVACMDTALGLEIAERTAELHFLSDAMPQIVWTARPDGKISYLNQRWYEYCGCAPGSLNWQEQIHPEDLPGALRLWQRAVRTGQVLQMETRLRSREGRYRLHLTRAQARRDLKGTVVQWVGTTTDIDHEPEAGAPAASPDVTPTTTQAPVTENETVLVVENAPSVQRLVRNMLSEQGYRILEASSAIEARQIFEDDGAEIQLLLTELVMPQASGIELARELSAKRPGLRVLFMSGRSESTVMQQEAIDVGTSIIQKPFTSAALTRRVREVLAGRSSDV